jgi:hypothetical protein
VGNWKGLLQRITGSARTIAATLALLGAAAYFASVIHEHYPIREWLFWRYAAYWGAVLSWALACFSVGSLVVDRGLKARLPLVEHALFAFTLGQFAFAWLMFLLGSAQAYRTATFFLAPTALILLGFDSLKTFAFRVRALSRRAPFPARSLVRLVAIGFGFIGLLMVYFTVLTPENVQFDSLWKHMALAEDYVAHGGIRRSTEGWVFAARPHLTSYVYSWAFLMPESRLFDRMLLCAHLEYFTFVVTSILGVSALVRKLIPRADPTAVWAARFLFPGVFLYDSSLSGGTDHFAALYGPPIALALFRALHNLELRWVALLATLLAGPSLVKETAALMLVPFPVLAIGVRWGMDVVRRVRGRLDPAAARRLWMAPLVGIGFGLVMSIPLWLQNLVLYGDPLYPNLARFFPARPWSEAAAYRFQWAYSDRLMWAPSRDWAGLVETFKALFSYSFDPNDWKRAHGEVPVFGSLFTLLLVALPVLRKVRRIWLVALWIHLGILAWYWVHHQDRYLQAVVPLMAACVAAILVTLWRSFGPLVKVAAASLVALQVIWGGDVYFIQTHAMIRSPVKAVVDLLSSGYEGKYEERLAVQQRFQRIAEKLPKRARVLIHELHPHLGVEAESVLDSYQWQSGIEYGEQGSPEGVRAMLRRLGVTHVYYSPGRSNSVASFASNLLFAEFVNYHATERTSVPGGVLVTVPNEPSTVPFRNAVVALTCKDPPVSGLYEVKALDVFPYGPNWDHYGAPVGKAADRNEALRYLPEADWVVLEPRCYRKGRYPKELQDSFEHAVNRRRDTRELWRRKTPSAEVEAVEVPKDAAADEDVP